MNKCNRDLQKTRLFVLVVTSCISFCYSDIRTRVISGFGGMGDKFDLILSPMKQSIY
jgi:hypothetical protein